MPLFREILQHSCSTLFYGNYLAGDTAPGMPSHAWDMVCPFFRVPRKVKQLRTVRPLNYEVRADVEVGWDDLGLDDKRESDLCADLPHGTLFILTPSTLDMPFFRPLNNVFMSQDRPITPGPRSSINGRRNRLIADSEEGSTKKAERSTMNAIEHVELSLRSVFEAITQDLENMYQSFLA